ncbi:MAG: alpha/beta hydrolase [Fibrobacteres bacterium]|nr:alpha/beta hydrolase [Fibrobacterota bacterium]
MFVFIFICCNITIAKECVILVHGLARTSKSFNKLEKVLSGKGYNVINVDYDSRKHSISDLADLALAPILKNTAEYDKVNFVTHSMGGIIVREYFSKKTINNLGRVVMLGPPNKGSEVAENLKEWSFYKLINGPAGGELGIDSSSTPNKLGPVNFELGVIAGDRSINWINSMMIKGADDGKVSIESTKITGMVDHIIIHTTHPLMMKNEYVIDQVIYFLKNGKFSKKESL